MQQEQTVGTDGSELTRIQHPHRAAWDFFLYGASGHCYLGTEFPSFLFQGNNLQASLMWGQADWSFTRWVVSFG